MWFFSSRKARRTTTKSSHRPTFRPRVRSLEDRCLMSAGMLDPTFNPTGSPPGTAIVPQVGGNDYGYCTLVQPSGKVVVAGESTSSKGAAVMVAEIDPNGTLDPAFGSGGVVTTTKGGAPTIGRAAALYPTGGSGDQKILVVGPGNGTFALVRYNADGSLDTSFNSSGIVDTSFKQGGSAYKGVVLVPNGTSPKIVVAGSDSNNAGVEFARYNSNGSLDTTFGLKGTAYIALPGGMNFARLARDPVNGDLIVAGQNGELAAFTSTGSLDTSFGTSGVLNTGITSQFGLTVDDAGRIVVGGPGGVARYSLTGTLDTSWGGTGAVAVAGWSLAIQPDGKVLARGGASVSRLNGDGSLDNTFGTNGSASTGSVGGTIVAPPTVTLAPNGDIVVGSDALLGGGNYQFAAARLLPSEPEIGSFTANQVMAGGPVTLTASNISDGNPNSSISQVSFFYYDSSGNKVIVGTVTAPDGSGNWTLSASLPPGSYTFYAQATDSYGVLGDPLAYSLTVQ